MLKEYDVTPIVFIPNAALVIVPRAGHMAPIEQPDAVIAALDTWLA